MQILRLLLAAYFAIAFVACAPEEPTPEEMLQAGRWEISNVNDLQSMYPNMSIKKSYMEFSDDGTMLTYIDQLHKSETGTWSLSADKSYLFIKADSSVYHDSLAFNFEDPLTLVIMNQDNKLVFRRTEKKDE